MKNKLQNRFYAILILMLVLAVNSARAQETKNGIIMSFGIGDNMYQNGMGDFPYSNFYKIEVAKKYPSALFKFEYKTGKKSGYVFYANYSDQGYTSTTEGYYAAEHYIAPVKNSAKLETLQLGLRYNSYLVDKSKFQLYVGGGIGWKYHWLTCSSTELLNYSPLRSVGVQVTFGARYFVTPHFAFYSEVGISNALSQAGFAFKF